MARRPQIPCGGLLTPIQRDDDCVLRVLRAACIGLGPQHGSLIKRVVQRTSHHDSMYDLPVRERARVQHSHHLLLSTVPRLSSS